ncbi:hypothetical protein RSOLAG1IB_07522 [Rhizoctonia solani AG-1 IB]|uniref:Uncharacterized protein n=1 Tax=Thanatephorus cucumeris (strain AG1-IB / isolate 7/3/14) TaxID=1108050 RepID=A0A0B7FGR4_THACB|nr:hypothetical protein RSOLAG1IB_07522 [Rhizoctonia solani AG-1 IB]
MKFCLFTFISVWLTASVAAQQPVWAQCGDYYQCQPGAAQTPPTISTSTTQASTPTATSSAPSASGTQIRAVQDPVYHLYLQNSGGTPVLASESTSGRFVINGSIALVSGSSKLYLNINASTTSYKSLTFGSTASTLNWGLEGDTIITTNASPYGRQLNFLACTTSATGSYQVYLQTGNDMPSGTTCSTITLHLPCLC